MNTDRFTQLERKRLLEVAREYENKGYRVEVEPSRFPTSLQDVRPDLVAISEDDSVVVEVVSKQSIGNRERLESLAKSVEMMPGWRFELVVTNPREQPAEDISLDEIRNRLQQAHQLDQQAISVPALLSAWSAVEALLRHLAATEGIEITRPAPLRLVKTLYSLGALTRSEYELLEEAIQIRNATVHGFQPAEHLSIHIALQGLLEAANRLLRRIEPSLQVPGGEYTIDELIEWFFDNYEDPANGVPYEGGYIYIFGGPYDAWDELSAQFPDASEELIQEAVEVITRKGVEWVRRGQY